MHYFFVSTRYAQELNSVAQLLINKHAVINAIVGKRRFIYIIYMPLLHI